MFLADEVRIKEQEKLWGVKMVPRDWKFYENQKCNPPIGYCEGFVDRQWELSNKRKMQRLNRSRDESLNQSYVDTLAVVEDPLEEQQYQKRSIDIDYDESSPKKTKFDFDFVTSVNRDDLPSKYRHTRDGLRSVKPEIYRVISILSSEYHMSKNQIEGSLVTIANELFGRKEFGEWKVHDKTKIPDNNTLPCMSNIRRTERYMEALALDLIVQEIMDDGN